MSDVVANKIPLRLLFARDATTRRYDAGAERARVERVWSVSGRHGGFGRRDGVPLTRRRRSARTRARGTRRCRSARSDRSCRGGDLPSAASLRNRGRSGTRRNARRPWPASAPPASGSETWHSLVCVAVVRGHARGEQWRRGTRDARVVLSLESALSETPFSLQPTVRPGSFFVTTRCVSASG